MKRVLSFITVMCMVVGILSFSSTVFATTLIYDTLPVWSNFTNGATFYPNGQAVNQNAWQSTSMYQSGTVAMRQINAEAWEHISTQVTPTTLKLKKEAAGWDGNDHAGFWINMANISDVFGVNQGRYVYEMDLKISNWGIDKAFFADRSKLNCLFFRIGTNAGDWQAATSYRVFRDGWVRNHNQSTPIAGAGGAAIAENDEFKMIFVLNASDSRANSRISTYIQRTDEQGIATTQLVWDNIAWDHTVSVEGIGTIFVGMYIDATQNVEMEVQRIRLYKSPVAPSATKPVITGNVEFGATLTADYTYDSELPEKDSVIEWYTYDNPMGTEGETLVKTATFSAGGDISAKQYSVTEQDVGKYLKVKVTPKNDAALTQYSTGEAVYSDMPEIITSSFTGELTAGETIGADIYFKSGEDSERNLIFALAVYSDNGANKNLISVKMQKESVSLGDELNINFQSDIDETQSGTLSAKILIWDGITLKPIIPENTK